MSAAVLTPIPSPRVVHVIGRDNPVNLKRAIRRQLPVTAECGAVFVPKFEGNLIPADTPLCPGCHPAGRGAKPHYVYRYYDADGRLLYVGCTVNPVQRERQHEIGSVWYSSVARVRRTVFPDRAYALEVEKRAIQTESPLHNRQHRVKS